MAKSRIEEATDTLRTLAQFTTWEELTEEERKKGFHKFLDLGSEKIQRDLKYLVTNLPMDDPQRKGAEILLRIVNQVLNK